MKNREWLNGLTDAEFIYQTGTSCDMCAYVGKDCMKNDEMNCYEGCVKWLEQEHEGEVSHEKP